MTGTAGWVTSRDVPDEIRDLTGGGAHLSIDALGHSLTCFNSIACLRKRGRHVQIGVMAGEHALAPMPMDRVMLHELEIVGSHGMQAHRYPEMLAMIRAGTLQPKRLIGRTIGLEEAIDALVQMDRFAEAGVTVINRF